MVWWEVILVAAVASSTIPLVVNGLNQEQDLSNTDLLQEQDELDTDQLQEQSQFGLDSLRYDIDAAGNIVNYTGMQREQDELDTEQLQGYFGMDSLRYDVGAAGNIVNYTGMQSGYRMENIADQVETLSERGKKCIPTVSCDRAGGFCVKRRNDCNGTIDPFGCRGSKKCKCCIPGSSSSSNINWLKAGADRFFRFDQKMNWTDARKFCKSFGNHIDLYQPRNSTMVSEFLQETFPERLQWSWLGGRGDGSNIVWIPSGDVMTAEDPWVYPQALNQTATNACLWLISNVDWDRGVLNIQDGSCNRDGDFYALCG